MARTNKQMLVVPPLSHAHAWDWLEVIVIGNCNSNSLPWPCTSHTEAIAQGGRKTPRSIGERFDDAPSLQARQRRDERFCSARSSGRLALSTPPTNPLFAPMALRLPPPPLTQLSDSDEEATFLPTASLWRSESASVAVVDACPGRSGKICALAIGTCDVRFVGGKGGHMGEVRTTGC